MKIFTSIITLFVLITISAHTMTARAFDGPTSAPSMRGDGVLTLFRPVKQHRETFRYRDKKGNYDPKVFDDIAHFFRCRLTDEAHPIDPYLIEIIDAVEDHFGEREIRVISAFRSELRNILMSSRGRRVARKSLHMEGKAADIEVQGVSPRMLRDFAYKLKQGGIGYYRGRQFVHVDTGPLRTWGWKPAGSRLTTAVANK